MSLNLKSLTLLMLLSGPVYAASGDEQEPPDEGKQALEEGETIWLEEKINPSTRWLEGLVKPMTTWMEKKVQGKIHGKTPQSPTSGLSTPSASFKLPEGQALIDEATISELARQLVPGQVLRVKLMQREPLQYRVKLISEKGLIHMLYFNALNGEAIPSSPATAKGS